MTPSSITVFLVAALLAATASAQDRFCAPFRLQTASGDWIDVGDGMGYAGPTLADVDGDGKRDLVVGQFARGLFRVYRNLGTEKKPLYAKHEFLQAGEALASVPIG